MSMQCVRCCEKEKGNRKMARASEESRQRAARRWGSKELRESSRHPSGHPSLVSSSPSIRYLFPKKD